MECCVSRINRISEWADIAPNIFADLRFHVLLNNFRDAWLAFLSIPKLFYSYRHRESNSSRSNSAYLKNSPRPRMQLFVTGQGMRRTRTSRTSPRRGKFLRIFYMAKPPVDGFRPSLQLGLPITVTGWRCRYLTCSRLPLSSRPGEIQRRIRGRASRRLH